MTLAEVQAHLFIIGTVNDAIEQGWHWSIVQDMTWKKLEVFRPRCPKCRTAVAWTPWIDGLRAAKCGRCKHGWKEASCV